MIRDLVQEILDFKLKENDFKSYCRLVRLVIKLHEIDQDSLFSTGYNYAGLLRNIIHSNANPIAFNPKEYLIDSKLEDYSTIPEDCMSGVKWIRKISKELLVEDRDCNLDLVVYGVLNIVLSLGDSKREDLVTVLRAIAGYWDNKLSNDEARKEVSVTATAIIFEYGNHVETERAKLLSVMDTIKSLQYVDKYYTQQLVNTLENMLRWGF